MSAKDSPRRLRRVVELFHLIESQTEDQLKDSKELVLLRSELQSFVSESEPHLHHLADIAKHLQPGLSLRAFCQFLVPAERALSRELKDGDFLISRQDHLSRKSHQEVLPLHLVLDHLRSGFNVGSILRTAEAFGLKELHLGGYTPGLESTAVQRSALGAEQSLPLKAARRTQDILKELRRQGVWIIGFETSAKAKALSLPFPRQETAFVLGNERFGLEAEILELCDEVRELPLKGVKNSLNVAVFAGIAVHEWSRQWTNS